MARIKIRSSRAVGTSRPGRGLTDTQINTMVLGFEIGDGAGFETPEEYRSAWWAHREQLLAAVPYPFHRPDGYWDVEVGIIAPGSMSSVYKSGEDALLRLGLPLTPEERAIIAGRERAGQIADVCDGEVDAL